MTRAPRPPWAIVIAAADPTWGAQFESERARLTEVLGERALRIEHVGSTSVPGLGAKPVIDIQISVSALHPLELHVVALEPAGYWHQPHPDDDHYPFFCRPADWPHTHHLHLCEAGSEPERRHLAFRDYLRDHTETAADYEALKRELAERLADRREIQARDAYVDAKSDFIAAVVESACRAGYPNG